MLRESSNGNPSPGEWWLKQCGDSIVCLMEGWLTSPVGRGAGGHLCL